MIISLIYPASVMFPELLLPLSTLLHRITAIRESDIGHTQRLLDYLHSHLRDRVPIRPRIGTDIFATHCSSSHAIHHDRLSQEGYRITLGRVTLAWDSRLTHRPCKTAEQSGSAASATAIIATFDVRDLLHEIGFHVPQPIVFYDARYRINPQQPRNDCDNWLPSNSRFINQHIMSGATQFYGDYPSQSIFALTHLLSQDQLHAFMRLVRDCIPNAPHEGV